MHNINKTCLIINFWLGDRRKFPIQYDVDKLIFLKKQIEFLTDIENSLDTIYFSFNVETEQYTLLSEAINLIPKKINDTKTKINIRNNFDFSYGAWNEIVKKEKDNFDYFIFLEDDYVFSEPKWDSYLLNKFKSKSNMGYLGMAVRELHVYPEIKTEMGYDMYESIRESFHSVGMTSSENIKKILNKNGSLIEEKNTKEYGHEDRIELTQTRWSAQYYEYGLENFDVRNEYAVEFQLTDRSEDIWKLFFEWNDKILIKSLRTILQPNYVWYRCDDYDYQRQKEYE